MSKRTTYISLSQSDIAIQIERLVQAIEDTTIPAFRVTQLRPGQERVQATKLSKYFDHIQQMVGLFDDRYPYDYSEHTPSVQAGVSGHWPRAESSGADMPQ